MLENNDRFYLLKNYTKKELEKLYRQERNEAKSRIKALKDSEFSDSKILKNKEYLKEDPRKMTKLELAKNLSYTDSFNKSKLSTIEGQEEQKQNFIETMQTLGHKINNDNYRQFVKYIQDSKAHIENYVLKSDDMVELYDFAQENNISPANVRKNFAWYMKNKEKIENLSLNVDRNKKYTITELKVRLARAENLEKNK